MPDVEAKPAEAPAAEAPKENTESKENEVVLTERKVITEKLMRDAVIKHMDQNENSVQVTKESLVLEEVSELSLSFENIYCIDNIVGFKCLTKLQLDNNIIEKVQGLDELVNLTWLDLSFNNISKIEGLDKLVNLTDLSLFNNCITKIENLDKCTNLHVLSLGNNQITSLDEIRSLRQFGKLRLLNLKGNPVTENDDYTNTVLAFLIGLKYLDYKLIEKKDITKARDAKLDQLVELEETEKQNKIKDIEKKKLEDHGKLLKEANIDLILRLFDEIVYKADDVYPKIKILPGLSELHEQYRERMQTILQPLEEDVLGRHEIKMTEKKDFMATRERHTSTTDQEAIAKIQDFEAIKKKVYARYKDALDNNGDEEGRPASHILESFKEEVESLRGDLMDLEMLLVEQLTDAIDEFAEHWTKELGNNSNKIAEVFALLQQEATWYTEALKDLVMKLLVEYAEHEINSENSITIDELRARAAAAAAQQAADEAKAQEEADADPGLDPDEIIRKKEEAEAEKKAKEKEENIFDNAELVKLMQDKDAINALVGSSGENHVSRLISAEDEIRDKEMRLGNKLVTDIRGDECSRNRSRVTEVEHLIKEYMKEIEETLDLETIEDDDEPAFGSF